MRAKADISLRITDNSAGKGQPALGDVSQDEQSTSEFGYSGHAHALSDTLFG